MNDDRGYGAMPKLYGAPAYARPPAVPVNPVDRPDDPDDLPLEAERLVEEEVAGAEVAPAGIPGRPYESAVAIDADPHGAAAPAASPARLRGRPFRLRIPGRG